jgi:hypothetical protein
MHANYETAGAAADDVATLRANAAPTTSTAPKVAGWYGSSWHRALQMAGGAALTYHGYKRNGSVLWAMLWGMLGGAAPLIAGPIAAAQGFGKPKGRP